MRAFVAGLLGFLALPAYAEQHIATASSAFNPAVSVILSGTYTQFSHDPAGYFLPGFVLPPDNGPGERGFSLGESELVMSANADDLFTGYIAVALTPANEAVVEEAFVRTIGLPNALTVKVGRFLSGIGYMNEQHPHVWDFVDASLAYRGMLATQYGDDGAQLRWLAPTELFVELGAEMFRGDAFPAGGAAKEGRGTYTAFAHIGGDIGTSHSYRVGVSRLKAHAQARETDDARAADTLGFTGDSTVDVVDFIWKWAPDGNAREHNFKFQAEYIRREETGRYSSSDAAFTDAGYDAVQSGWYAQAVYQFIPRWRAGIRYDALRAEAVPVVFAGTVLDPAGHDPHRASAMIDFSNSEFSRVRFQYNRDDSMPETDQQYLLQYIVSIGSHGAHRF